MILGLIPAGGRSRRMGQPKLSLPLGTHTVLEKVVRALLDGGADEVLVIVGCHAPELTPLARTAGAKVLLLAEETPDMRATIEQGLHWLAERFRPTSTDYWLLAPADHPTLSPVVVRTLIQSARALPAGSIVVPSYEGQRGHPVLIGWSHVVSMRLLPQGLGLNAYLRQQPQVTHEVAVDDAAILLDLDTPEDYQRLLGEQSECT